MKHRKLPIIALVLFVALFSGCAATKDPIVNYKDPAFKNIEVCIDLDACTAPKTAGDPTITYWPEPEDHEPFVNTFLEGEVTEKKESADRTTYNNGNKWLVIESNTVIINGKEEFVPAKGFSFSVYGEAESLSEDTLFQTLDSCMYYRQFLHGLNGNEFDFKPIAEVIEETDQILAEIGLSDMELCFYGAYSAETIMRLEVLLGTRLELEMRPDEQPIEDQYLLIYEKEASEQMSSRLYFTYSERGLIGAKLNSLMEEVTFENTYTPCTVYEAIIKVASENPNYDAQVISAEFLPLYNVWEILLRTELSIDNSESVYQIESMWVNARTLEMDFTKVWRNRFNDIQKNTFEKYKPDNVVYEAQ